MTTWGRSGTKNKWVIDGTGELVGTDERTITFYKGKDGPMIDFDITIKAGDKEMVFGDDKDGISAIRVRGIDAGGQVPKPRGEKTARPPEMATS